MTALQIFAQSLEGLTGDEYLSSVTLQPLKMPIYKEITVSVYKLGGVANRISSSVRCRIDNTDDKNKIVDDLTKQLMVKVMKAIREGSL